LDALELANPVVGLKLNGFFWIAKEEATPGLAKAKANLLLGEGPVSEGTLSTGAVSECTFGKASP
jgi:hypothetical protein